ncbi:MAG: M56 family metallopeptidase [Gemmatimonadota bacterium]
MIASWMVYAVCFGLLAIAGATLLERPLRERVGATRRLWIALIFVALIWPMAVVMVTRQAASAVAPELSSRSGGPIRQDDLSGAFASVRPAVTLPVVVPASMRIDRIALQVAIGGPMLLFALLLLEGVRLLRARRRWRRADVDGTAVLVSQDFGPAIVGIFRPAIVIPEWALELPAGQRQLMLTHESEHLAARDSSWLGIGFLGVALAPWNPGLWYLLRRFRFAMEADCDQRVLQRGYDVETYATLLIEIGRRSSGRSLLAAGFAERHSMLRTRIESLFAATAPATMASRWRLVSGAAIVAAACAVGPARSGAGTGTQYTLTALGPQVADSVVSADDPTATVRLARNLPKQFRVSESGSMPDSHPGSACANVLFDESDGTRLQLQAVIAGPLHPTPGSPARAHGFYAVAPAGRYGLKEDEWLRVGCSTASRIADRDGEIPVRVLDASLKTEFGITLDSLTRDGGQLHVAYAGILADTLRGRALQIARLLMDRLGSSVSEVDTVTVRVKLPEAWRPAAAPELSVSSFKWYFYRDQLTAK